MKSLFLAATITRNLSLSLALALLISACGQKGPLIVEPSDPLPTEALQEDAVQVDSDSQAQIDSDNQE
jgi:predicted small lipoprotein YifL